MKNISLTTIQPAHNPILAKIIRDTLKEFGANHLGTVYYDEDTDRLSQVFTAAGSYYFVAQIDGEVVGGAGIFPTNGLPTATAELVKMYLLPKARGQGIGVMLMDACIKKAQELQYKHIYIETMPELQSAIKLYQQYGFEKLNMPLGNTGHFGCAIQMLKSLN